MFSMGPHAAGAPTQTIHLGRTQQVSARRFGRKQHQITTFLQRPPARAHTCTHSLASFLQTSTFLAYYPGLYPNADHHKLTPQLPTDVATGVPSVAFVCVGVVTEVNDSPLFVATGVVEKWQQWSANVLGQHLLWRFWLCRSDIRGLMELLVRFPSAAWSRMMVHPPMSATSRL